MSVKGRALQGIGWTALASWVQLSLNVVTFFIIARYLDPEQFGLFGATLLVIGAIDTLLGPPLTQSLEQRDTLRRDHIDATFAISAALALLFAVAVAAGAPVLARFVGVEQGTAVLRCMAVALPITALGAIPTSLLSRELRFGTLSRIEVVAGILGSLVAISVAVLGGGVWALVAADLTHRTTRASGAFIAAAFWPAWPRRMTSFLELGAFNAVTLLTCGLAYLDWAVPRLLTSRILGVEEFGYYAFANRVFELLAQVVLQPIERVVLTTIARLKGDTTAIQATINSIYWLSTLFAYPAFLGAVVLAPDFVALQGAQWVPATQAMQILLLVGLRISTSTFNFGILRGTGQTRGPVLTLLLGVLIQLILVPIGAHMSIAWVAAAVLARTLLTWPLGCWLIKRATGLTISQQLRAGTPALFAALVMALAMQLTLTLAFAGAAPVVRLAVGVLVGSPIYGGTLLALSSHERELALSLWQALRSGQRATVLARLRGHFGRAE